LGSLGSSSVVKFTTGGVATATLTSNRDAGLATVTATCEGKQGQTRVLFYSYLFRLHLPLILKAHSDGLGRAEFYPCGGLGLGCERSSLSRSQSTSRGGSHAAEPRAWEPALLHNCDVLSLFGALCEEEKAPIAPRTR
jgi:hypothetical protein